MVETGAPETNRASAASAPVAPRRLQRLLSRRAVEPRELATAVARDALSMLPHADQARVTLDESGVEVRARRAPRRDSPELEHPLRSAEGRFGTLSLWLAPGAHSAVQAGLAATALGWAAAAISERTAHVRLQSRFAATLTAAPIGLAHLVHGGGFTMLNDRFCEITGHSREALLRDGFGTLIHPAEIRAGKPQVDALLAGEIDHYTAERRYLRPDKSVVWVNVTVTLIRQPDNTPEYFVLAIEDVSEFKRVRAEAERDALTGLLNRRGLLEHLERDRLRCIETGQPFTVIYVDLDDFKLINDRMGHAAGDRCMIAAAEAIWRTVGTGGRLGRVGGDEFVIALADVDDAHGALLAERLRLALGAVEVAPGWTMSASVGHATAEPGDGISPDDLLATADAAMFRFKNRRSPAPANALESSRRTS